MMDELKDIVLIIGVASVISNALQKKPVYGTTSPTKFQNLYTMIQSGVKIPLEETNNLSPHQQKMLYYAQKKYDEDQLKEYESVPIPKRPPRPKVDDLQSWINKVATLNGSILLPETNQAKHLLELADTILYYINTKAFSNLNETNTLFLQKIEGVFQNHHIPVDKSILDIKIKSKALKDLISQNYEKSIKLTCLFMTIQINKLLHK